MNLQIKVIPSSSKDCIAGWLNDILKIKVKAPADKGKANKAVISLLEKTLALPRGSVNIRSGLTSCLKIININVDNDNDIKERLARLPKQ